MLSTPSLPSPQNKIKVWLYEGKHYASDQSRWKPLPSLMNVKMYTNYPGNNDEAECG